MTTMLTLDVIYFYSPKIILVPSHKSIEYLPPAVAACHGKVSSKLQYTEDEYA